MKDIWGKKQKRILRICIGAIAAVWAAFFIHINLVIPPPTDKFIPQGKTGQVYGMDLTVEKTEVKTQAELAQKYAMTKAKFEKLYGVKDDDSVLIVTMKRSMRAPKGSASGGSVNFHLRSGDVYSAIGSPELMPLLDGDREEKAEDNGTFRDAYVVNTAMLKQYAAEKTPGRQLEILTAMYPVTIRFLLDVNL